MDVIIWHNPRCSKSCEALALIKARGIRPKIVDYLNAPPTAAEILMASRKLGKPVREMIRTKEERFRALGLDDPSLDEHALADALSANPALIERPVVFARGKAAIGRPPEAILRILQP